MKKSIVIITRRQFGYWTDYYYFSKYLKNTFNIYYLCYDDGLQKIELEGVNVKYISKKFKNNYFELLHFIMTSVIYSNNLKKKLIYINYFQYCFVFRFLMPFAKLILDIRTTSITTNEKRRKLDHRIIRFTTYFFNYITILAQPLSDELRLTKSKTIIIPLGADEVPLLDKIFNEFRLLYVGILTSRNIHETVIGLNHFLVKFPEYRSIISYDIVGFGDDYSESKLQEAIANMKSHDIVTFHGRKTIEESKLFWTKSNVGIVYVPKIPAYENQPPTKLFESFFQGIPVLATNTNENALYVNDNNGILIHDNPQSFSDGLEKLIDNRNNYSSSKIKESVKQYSWEKITENLSDLFIKIR